MLLATDYLLLTTYYLLRSLDGASCNSEQSVNDDGTNTRQANQATTLDQTEATSGARPTTRLVGRAITPAKKKKHDGCNSHIDVESALKV